MQNPIAVEGLKKSYGSFPAVKGIEFEVRAGEVFGLLGPNGAGKTTTVEILEGLRARTGGRVAVLGYDPEVQTMQVKDRVGVCLQSTNLQEKIRVREAIELFGSLYTRTVDAAALLQRLQLWEKREALYAQLSGGQKQRLALALALLNDPQVLFLDEPSAGLDPQARLEIHELVQDLPRNWISLLVMVSLGVCAFRALGLILASVTNTMQEAMIAIQLLYMPMLFLSGATIPSALLPTWAQTVAEFTPAPYLVNGFQGIFFRNQNLWDSASAAGALAVSIVLGTFLAVQLFRWEKGEKLPPRNKLWVLAVLGPFLLMGSYRAYTKQHIGENEALFRQLQRSGTFLVRNTRIFVGDGKIIENGAVLVHDGKIAALYEGAAPDADSLKAEVVEGAGKTLLPGLIDTHVHLGGPAGISSDPADYDPDKAMARADAALLYSGVTAARSVGDGLDASLKLRAQVANGSKLGALLFVCGPMFTAERGHGTEFVRNLPDSLRDTVKAQLLRIPKTPEEARRQVRELKARGVDGIKAILEAGWGDGMLFDRMDLLLVRAIGEEAHAQNLPLAVHTGDARDVTDAVEIGAASIEHGSWRDSIPDAVLERMARQGIYLDPTLAVAEAYAQYFSGKTDALANSLVEQVVPGRMLKATREFVSSGKSADASKAALFAQALQESTNNLLRAWQAGVPLAVGTDAGNPLVFHGPSLHHELQLWVKAGIPPAVVLQAATGNAAKLLRAGRHIGTIRKGMDADLLLVDGDPLQDISATERISLVVFQGERLRRSELFEEK